MQVKSSALALAAFGVGPLVLAAGCGGSTGDGARATISPIRPSSYVTIQPATTTTTTTIFVDPNTPGVPQISPVEQTYEIESGDSLSKIASQFDISVDVLCNYNGWDDCPGHLLLPGASVLVPPDTPILGSDGEAAAGDSATDTVGESDGPACTHTIVSGENPTRVARTYDLTFDQLQLANPFMDFRTTFVVGDTLNIPPEGTC